ncbi:MAG: 6-phosphofructokinase, partial [Bacteroidota bacterium]
MSASSIRRIAVFTSGGDAPGMNAAIRAVVRTAAYHKIETYGIRNGYEGMIDHLMEPISIRQVGNIIYRGGTILKTARSMRFMEKEGRRSAYDSLRASAIDACIAIGGNGTFTGAKVFSEEYDIPFIGVPGTIDNDLFGTDLTIGYDTAVNTAMRAVDNIRDTADSHNRLFFVEVMGRNSGFIALSTGIASGAGNVLVPESETTYEHLEELLRMGVKRRKSFGIIVVAEGNKLGSTEEIAQELNRRVGYYDTKVTIIGHLQRGGSPTAIDRLLASRLRLEPLTFDAVAFGLDDQATCQVMKTPRPVLATCEENRE